MWFCYIFFFFVMLRRPPRFTLTDTCFPYTTLFRSGYLKLKAYMADIHKAVVPVPATAGGAVAPVAPPPDLGTLLASADPAKGERLGKVCATCHSFTPGGPHLLGPHLWAVVGGPGGSHGGFHYSALGQEGDAVGEELFKT